MVRAFSGREIAHMDVIEQEDESISNHGQADDESREGKQVKENIQSSNPMSTIQQQKPHGRRAVRPAPLQILNRVKINNIMESPRSTIKGFLNSQPSELNFTRENLKRIEQKLKKAFIEFYQKLRLLQSYR